ncbi:dihydrofolate reductase family protein [Frankia sp. AiPs1]|uniref:RibD family protein n=1 Tax=Frankia sp. AiPs1 TaxID=573493 RepID=UPI0020445F24|nr:dihydrofolate reductase family protein [Frankia sp. AiPs1]MCM3921556.1 dihydrofolate reductase family protein [Frankia sp. AiPs1]
MTNDEGTRPYVLASCAMSVDGYIDDATPARLLLSNEEDFDRVDEVRASCDAILVGAETIRRDNPCLLVRSQQRRDARVAAGLPPSPAKVTLTSTGRLDPAASFFAATVGDAPRLVYCPSSALAAAKAIGDVATVVDAGPDLKLAEVLADLHRRGIGRLMVEGGTRVLTQFLTAGLVDELHLAVAPFFVGQPKAPRFVADGSFPWNANRRMRLAEVRQMGDVILLRYLPPTASEE